MEGSDIPLVSLDTNQSHVPLNNPDPTTESTNNDHSFTFKQHHLVLFCKTFVRCLATVILIASVLATLKFYQSKGNFASDQKTKFNIIITVLSLCLGLDFFVSHE